MKKKQHEKRTAGASLPMSVIDTIAILHIYDDNICDFEVCGL